MTRENFLVDLRGMVEILSQHLYSSPRVYLRELLQNARDAITARRNAQPAWAAADPAAGRVRLETDASTQTLVVTDDGVRLTARQTRDLLATIGATS